MNRQQREEKQLLQLRADALQLKLMAAKAASASKPNHSGIWNTAQDMLNHLPNLGLATRLVTSPRRLSTKILILSALAGYAWWRQMQEKDYY